MADTALLAGDALRVLRTLPSESVQCCVTSPPYWGLRDYGHPDQIGLERSPEEYVLKLVDVFKEVRRVLRPDGTLWVNMGDTYSGSGRGGNSSAITGRGANASRGLRLPATGPSKQLLGIPWRVALALQSDGWYLRSCIVWHKPNPMPESVTDRPTNSHEYIFLLANSERYYYNAEAIAEPISTYERNRMRPPGVTPKAATRNARSIWSITSKPYKGAHFATFPPALPRRCILAGSRPGDTVLDPFAGSGTTGAVARELGRSAILIELQPDYLPLIRDRVSGAHPPLFVEEVPRG